MNLKLVLQLSVFGLIMAFATVSLIPDVAESFFWLVIFIICAYLIAKRCTGRYFLHGFLTSIFNSIWITLVHFFFYNSYVQHHAAMAAKMTPHAGYFNTHPRAFMVLCGLPIGVLFVIVLVSCTFFILFNCVFIV